MFNDIDEIHQFRDTDDTFHIEDLCDVLCKKVSAATFKSGDRGDTGRREDILAQRGQRRIIEHKLHALMTHDISNFMRVRADGRGAPRDNGLAQMQGNHHGTFDMHVAVNKSGE